MSDHDRMREDHLYRSDPPAQRRWRVFHADGPAPPPDVLALRGSSGVWDRVGDDLWRCPGGTTFLTWAEMPPEWGRYVECPSWQAVVEADEQTRTRR